MQAYNDDQRFEHRFKPSGGFEVLIEMPYQTKKSVAALEQQAGDVTIEDAGAETGTNTGVAVQGAITA